MLVVPPDNLLIVLISAQNVSLLTKYSADCLPSYEVYYGDVSYERTASCFSIYAVVHAGQVKSREKQNFGSIPKGCMTWL